MKMAASLSPGPLGGLAVPELLKQKKPIHRLAPTEGREKSLYFSPKIALPRATSQGLGAMVTKPSNMSPDRTDREKPETLANSIQPQGCFTGFGSKALYHDDFLRWGISRFLNARASGQPRSPG